MIQLQQKYALRLEKMGMNSLCFFFIFWIAIYVLLMIVNHLGPSLYQSQLINSPTNRCVDEIQNRTTLSSVKLPYYICQLTIKPQEYGIKDTFLIRVVALLNNTSQLINKSEKYQMQLSQVNYVSDEVTQSEHTSYIPSEIEYNEFFPKLNETNYNNKWKIIHNNLKSAISFNCKNNTSQKQTFEGCFSDPFLEEQRDDIKKEYQFFIKINKQPHNQNLLVDKNTDSARNNTQRRSLLQNGPQRNLNGFNGLEQRRLEGETATQNPEESDDKTQINQPEDKQKDVKQDEKEQGLVENNNNIIATSKIRKILFQLKYKNSNHQLEMIMKSLYSIVTAGFLIYTMMSLKNFYVDQLISIQKWIRYLLAFLLVYNSPVHLFFPSNKVLLMVTRTGELIFLSLIMYFWLSIKSMYRHGSNSQQKQESKSQLKGLKNFLKLILVCLHNAPRLFLSLFAIGGAAAVLNADNEKGFSNFDSFDIIHQLVIGTFFIYGLCIIGSLLKVCIESNIDINFKFLCYFTYSVFYTYGYICYQEFYIPEENHSSYFMLNKESILNIYMYVICYLYLPVENKNDEQQYNLDHNPEHEEEDEEQKHKEIIGEVYKDIEMMDETIKNHSHIHNTSAEQKKQKIWEQIQKSMEDDEEEYEEKKQNDSDGLSSSDEEDSKKHSSGKKLGQKGGSGTKNFKKQPINNNNNEESPQKRQQKFMDDAEDVDDKEFIYE